MRRVGPILLVALSAVAGCVHQSDGSPPTIEGPSGLHEGAGVRIDTHHLRDRNRDVDRGADLPDGTPAVDTGVTVVVPDAANPPKRNWSLTPGCRWTSGVRVNCTAVEPGTPLVVPGPHANHSVFLDAWFDERGSLILIAPETVTVGFIMRDPYSEPLRQAMEDPEDCERPATIDREFVEPTTVPTTTYPDGSGDLIRVGGNGTATLGWVGYCQEKGIS